MITKIHSASVDVSNQEAALDFYLNKLGWEKRLDEPMGPDLRFVTVAPIGGATELALLPPGMANGQPGGMTGISLSVENIDETFKTLSDRGVKFVDGEGNPVDAPHTEAWGDKASWLKDPDGNTFYFIEG